VSEAPETNGAVDPRRIMTEAEVAAMLRVRPATVASLARRGELVSLRFGRFRRYLFADVAAFIERKRQVAEEMRSSR
jgi:excisionase family DNA binding protein